MQQNTVQEILKENIVENMLKDSKQSTTLKRLSFFKKNLNIFFSDLELALETLFTKSQKERIP